MKNKNKQTYKNENLVFLDEERFNSDLLSVTYLINKKDTCISALKTYMDLIIKSSLIFNSERKLSLKLAKDLYGATLTYNLRQTDFDYVLTVRIKSLQNRYCKGFRNVQLEAARMINNLLSNGYNGNSEAFKQVIKDNVEDIRRYEQIDKFILERALHLNFLPNMSYGNYKYGTTDEFLSLKEIDMTNVKQAIKNAQVLVDYIGDCNANCLIYIHDTYKPTPLNQALRSGDFVVKDDVFLKTSENVSSNIYSCIFTIDSFSTTKLTLIGEFIERLLNLVLNKNLPTQYLLPKRFSLKTLYKGNLIIYESYIEDKSEIDNIDKKVKSVILNLKDYLTQDVFEIVKNELKIYYLKKFDDIYLFDDYIVRGKLLNISTDLTKTIETLDEITIDDIRKRTNLIKIVGSIYLEK